MRAWRWWAMAGVVVLFVAVAVVPQSTDRGGGTAAFQQPSTPTIGFDVIETVGERTRVLGWVRADEPVSVLLSAGHETVAALATQRRPDLDTARGSTGHWGFAFETAVLPSTSRVCVEAVESCACRPVGCAPVLFDDAYTETLAEQFPTQRVTAHVFDHRTGCAYELAPGLRITTASVVKLEILGDLLLDVQRAGRDLTSTELRLAEDMMHYSLNDATASLYRAIGGVSSLTAHSASVGATSTVHTANFGATWSTAADRTAVASAVLAGTGSLRAEGVEVAWKIATGVARSQSWGLSAGLPIGWRAVGKNGFYPYGQYRWRVGSSGFVADPTGGGYAVTIMSDGNAVQMEGVTLVEEVARHIAAELTWGAPGPRLFDEVDCITHASGQSWLALTLDLGLPADAAADVRRAAGGDGPLRGHMVCTP